MSEFEKFVQIVARLRAKDGCPWDREQTHSSLKPGCIEEACEVVSGINIYEQTGKADNLKEELGDLLLQVVMHCQIAKEEGLFDIEDVCREISDKMVRRHPHVFGEVQVEDSAEVLRNWDDIKKKEHAEDEIDINKYLFDAFDESKELIEKARERKIRKIKEAKEKH